SELIGLLAGLRAWMAPGGRAFVVASRSGTSADGLREAGAAVTVRDVEGYAILEGRWSAL
ncbi:MAG: hypothetical protein IAG13_07090, partial [Deltaproteobacteria bacterium]|nr:hypothetical protein [Nannocystaceae bacterium]